MALRSRELYKCFIKNFQNLKGENQRALREAMTAWYNEQSLSGVRALIGKYDFVNDHSDTMGFADATVLSLLSHTNKNAPERVKRELEDFFRRALTDDRLEVGSFDQISIYLNAMIALEKLDALNPTEKKIFNRLRELGGIKSSPKDPDHYYSSPSTDLTGIFSI